MDKKSADILVYDRLGSPMSETLDEAILYNTELLPIPRRLVGYYNGSDVKRLEYDGTKVSIHLDESVLSYNAKNYYVLVISE